MVPDLLQKKPKRDDEQLQQGGTDSRRTGTSATGTRLTYGSKYSPTKQHTYELNTGSKTYTLSADQIVYLREANRSTWADAYGFDDEDQQRRSAGLAPRAVAQQYKNTRLDSWLLENDLPASRYLDSYLESYEAYRAEQAERRRRADAKTELYQSAARASTMLELEGIYNDDRTYEKDGVTATGRDFHSNAFFDLLERSGLSDAYVYAPSTAEKAPEDFASAAEYREYQLKQAAKQEDAAADWDALTSISYEDYLKNSARLIREEKARKLVGDVSVSGVETVGDAIEYSERQRKQDTYNALMGGGDVEAFARDADEDPAAIIAEMEEYGVDEKTLRRTVDAFRDQAFTDEQRQSIDDAYSAYEQRQKEKKQQEKEQERQRQQRQDALEDIFSGAMRGYGGITKKNALAALDEARDAGYDEDEILEAGRAFLERNGKNSAFDREAWNLLQYGGEAAADAAQQQAQDEKSQEQEARQKQRTADDLLKAVSEAYEQEQVDISALTVEEAQGRFLSLLEYRGVDVVDESVADAVQTLLDEGVSYTVLREATAQALSSPRMQYLNNRVTGEQAESYQHEMARRRTPQKLTVSMIVEQGLEQARAEDRRQLAAAYREELAGRGYSGYEIDQALRRGGMADTLDDEAAAHNYYEAVDVPRMLEAEPDSWAALQQMYPGMTAQDYAVDTWENMTAEERAAYVQQFASTAEINTDLHRPHGEQLKMQFVAILPRVIMSTLSGVVNVADMATAAISGREQRWGLSEELSEAAAAAYAYGRSSGQDAASTVISGASDIATEVVRMYALGVAGRGIAAPFAGVMGRLGAAGAQAASGASSKALGSIIRYGTELITHAPNTAPFVISAMGSGYAEAMESGASVGEATLYGLVTGSLEGALEAFNVDSIWGRALGTRRVAEQLLTAGRQAMRNPVGRARLTSLVAGFLGEFTEESASYAASVWMQRATYAPDASFELGEMLSQGLMGGLVGLFGAGAGLGQITESRIVADYILENGDYSPTLLDILDAVQRSESMDAEQRVQYESSGEVLPLAEFRRQAAAARTAEENLTRAQEKLDSRLAELDAEQQRLQADEAQKREDWQAVPADAASVKQKRAAFEAWKDAHGKYEKFANNRAADETSARTDYEASTWQNQDALRVANDRMNGHYVRLASLFRDDVAAMERARDVQLTRTDARRRYDAAAQRIDGLMDTETERPDGQTDTGVERPAQYTIQQGGPNDGRAETDGEAGTENRDTGRRLLDGGREVHGLEADGRADSGGSGSGSPRGGALSPGRVDRRTVRRDGLYVLTESRERLTQAGVTDFGLSVTEDHQAFSDALNRMRAENPNGASVDPQSVEELAGALTFANPKWTAGGAVQPSGNIVAVFKNGRADSRKKAGLDILFHAIALGGDRLDCYGRFLVNTYARGGMVPVARVAYARGINPEMDAFIDFKRRQGNPDFATDPDIYFMKLRAGARYEDLVDDYVTGRYHHYTPEELDALPLMSYDEAEAYRDSLLEQERRQGDYAGAVQELGEAAQQEDAAGAEGVDRAAVDAKMRAARAGGAEAAQEAAGAAAGNDASEAQTAATEAQRPSWADVDAGAQARAVSLGERLGVPVVFEQMPEGFTGRHEDGVIHIATRLPAGEAPEMTVLRHELTHYLEGSAEYGALSDYVVQLAQRLNPQLNVNRVLEGLAEEYATRGVELSPDGARREFVARFVQDKLLRDETAIDRLVRERSGVAGRVLNWIEYRIARLKLRGQNSAEARALLEAERLYAKAFARAGTFDQSNPIIRFSQKADEGTESAPGRIYDYSKPFAEQVDDWMAGRIPQYDTLLIGRTPLLYRQIGLSDVPMTIDQTHLDYMVNGTKNEDHHLGVALVKQLPELLEHPVAVIESATRPGDSVMAIVKGKVNGKQLMAAVRIGGNGVQNGAQIDSNHIVSAQGRGNAVTKLLNDALQKELRGEMGVYYWNKNEALPLIVDSGVQFPGRLINDDLIHSIFDAASPVNRNYLEQTETRQFKRWYGRSSVVQADGTPRAVRQGVDATVEVLDGKTALQDGEAVYVKLKNPYPAGTAAEAPGRAALEAGGYDGAVYQDENGGTHYAVLDGTQIKSATDNIGTFDRHNADIRYSLNGLTWDEMVARYGAKPAGAEPRTRDEAVPERAGDEQRVSDFLRSFVESDKATDEMVAQVRAAVENGDFGVYTEQSNDRLRSQAQDAIALKGLPRSQEDFSAAVRAGRIDAGTVATGLQLLAEASARGDAAGTLDLVADLCVCATETGRSVQAFSMLKKLGGAGSAYYMQKVEDRLNARYEAEIASGRMLPVKIDGTLMQSLATARTAAEIAQAEEQIARNIGEQLPLSFQQKLSNWRYFAMLANPTTHIRNMTGNALMAGARRVKDAVATGLERAFVPDASERAHAVYSRRSQADRLAYADRSFEAHRQDLMGGGKYGFETFLKQNQRLFEGRALNALAQLNFKALEGEDAIFLRSAYRDAMVQYLTAQRLDPAALTPQQEAAAADWAGQEALRATFRDASQLAALLNRAANTGSVARLAVEGVMPFKKTPINIAKRGVEFSPIGILQGAYQLTAGVKSGRYTVAQGIDRIASGITGTGMIALGAMLARLGVLRGAGEDDRKYETFLRAGGAQGYSLTLGDWSVNISGLAPATIPLFMGVSLYETIEREEAFDMSALVDALAGATDPLMEMSFMSSLNSALESYNQNGLGGALGAVAWNAASSYLSQYVPTFTGKVGQFADPVERTTKADATSPLGGSLDSFLRSVLKKVPGAEATLEPAVDVWGRTQRRTAFGEWALDFFNTFLSPGTVRVQNRTAVDEELIRLVEATGETGFLPTAGQKYFTVGGQRFEMDARQYTLYSQERGQACYAAIKSVLQSAQYRAADDAARAALLEQAVDNAEKTVSDKYKELLGAYDQ